MTDKKSSESRRKLLKSIAAGSGAIVAGKSLPDSWSKPVVDSVVLPAHAATSSIIYSEQVGFQIVHLEDEKSNMLADISETLIPSASAGGPSVQDKFWFCITTAGGMADVAMRGPDPEMERTGMLDLEGKEGVITGTSFGPDCSDYSDKQLNRPARIHSVNESEIVIEVQGREHVKFSWLRYTVPSRPEGCTNPPAWYDDCD